MQAYRLIASLITGCIAASACGEPVQEQEAQVEESRPILPDQGEEPVPAESFSMPAIPEPRRGHLVGHMTGQLLDILDGSWKAVATLCEDPPMIEMLAREPSVGTIVVLQLPLDGNRLVDYPVTIVERGMPPGPASQIGVHILSRSDVSAFQAMEGVVSVYELGDRISGKFTATLRMVGSEDQQKYAGIFQDIPIDVRSSDECRRMMEAMLQPDSAFADSPLNDSLPR